MEARAAETGRSRSQRHHEQPVRQSEGTRRAMETEDSILINKLWRAPWKQMSNRQAFDIAGWGAT